MKSVALVLAVVGSTFASFYVGTSYTERRQATQTNLCLTDKAIVSTLEQSLAAWTKKDVQRYGVDVYQRSRRNTANYVNRFKDVAPCTINDKFPRDITKGG